MRAVWGPNQRSPLTHGPRPCKFIGFGDIQGPKSHKFIRFGNIHGPKPYKFIGFGDIHGPKPYKFIGFGDIHGPKPTSWNSHILRGACKILQKASKTGYRRQYFVINGKSQQSPAATRRAAAGDCCFVPFNLEYCHRFQVFAVFCRILLAPLKMWALHDVG